MSSDQYEERQKNILKGHEYFSFVECPGASTVLVVFSARNDRPPKFTFWKTCQSLACHVVFLNCKVPDWYRNGIPGLPGGIRGAVAELIKFKERVGATRLVMLGSSMGGYGALLYGSMAPADEILIFGVEPVLGVPGGKTEITRNHLQYVYPDLTSMRFPKVTLFYGGMDLHDTLGAWLLYKRRGVRVLCLPEAQHDSPDFLARYGRLGALFATVVNGDEIADDGLDGGGAMNDAVAHLLWQINNDVIAKNWQAVLKKLRANKAALEQSTLAKYYEAIALFRGGEHLEASRCLVSVLSVVPGYWEAWMNLSATLSKLGLVNEALSAGKCAIGLRPHRSIAHTQLSNVYQKINDISAAVSHAQWACRLNYSRQEYFERLSVLSGLCGKDVMLEKNALIACGAENTKLAIKEFSDFDIETKKIVLQKLSASL